MYSWDDGIQIILSLTVLKYVYGDPSGFNILFFCWISVCLQLPDTYTSILIFYLVSKAAFLDLYSWDDGVQVILSFTVLK